MNQARFHLDKSLGQLILPSRLRDAVWIGEGAKAGYMMLAKDHRLGCVSYMRVQVMQAWSTAAAR